MIFRHEGFSLRSKVLVLQRLLKRRYPNLCEKYSETFKKLDGVLKHRNILAHSGVAMSDKLLSKPEDRVLFAAFKQGNPYSLTISEKEHKAKLREAEEVRDELMELWVAVSRMSSNTEKFPR